MVEDGNQYGLLLPSSLARLAAPQQGDCTRWPTNFARHASGRGTQPPRLARAKHLLMRRLLRHCAAALGRGITAVQVAGTGPAGRQVAYAPCPAGTPPAGCSPSQAQRVRLHVCVPSLHGPPWLEAGPCECRCLLLHGPARCSGQAAHPLAGCVHACQHVPLVCGAVHAGGCYATRAQRCWAWMSGCWAWMSSCCLCQRGWLACGW